MQNTFLCDTSVFLSLWMSDEITNQRVYGEQFFGLVKKCLINVYSANIVDSEFKKRWPTYHKTYLTFCNELKQIKPDKLRIYLFSSNYNSNLIWDIQEDARNVYGLDLSFVDASLICISNELCVPIVSFDHGIIDYCAEKNYKASYPMDIIVKTQIE